MWYVYVEVTKNLMDMVAKIDDNNSDKMTKMQKRAAKLVDISTKLKQTNYKDKTGIEARIIL